MPFKVHCHVKPCGLTDGKAMDLDLEIDGDDSIGQLKDRIAEKTRIPKSLMVLYHPAARRVGGGEEALHDYDKIDMKLKTAGSAGMRECDVYVDESGMAELTEGRSIAKDPESGAMINSGKGDVDSRIHFGGHGGLAEHKGVSGTTQPH